MFTVVVPKLGDTMEEGKILEWTKREGDPVAKGEAVALIETEKTNMEVEAFAAGTLRKILVEAGTTLPVGAPIALIGDPAEPLPGAAADGGQQGAARSQVAPSPAPAAVGMAQQPVAQLAGGTSNGYAAQTSAPTGGRLFISPIARRIAAEHGVNVSAITGTGPSGRILREDVEAALTRQQAQAEAPAQPVPAQPVAEVVAGAAPTPAAVPGEEVEAVPLSAMRKTIARRLQQSMQTAPHIYLTVSVETNALGDLRSAINDYAQKLPQPLKVSYNDLIVKAVALTLASMPQVNASFDGERLLLKKHVHVGVAVALEQGLIVPVVRDADRRTVLEIARESARLVAAARAGKLKPEEFQGGTFTVSNLGMYDVESFTAVINPPEAAILAVGAIVPTPVVVDGAVVVRDRMKVTLSADHRALDGAIAARFLQELKRLLEQPMAMLV